MISGRLRLYQIEVLTPKVVIDEFGSQVTEYVHKFKTRAEVINTNNRRDVVNQDVVYIDRPIFSIRHYHKVDDFDIVVYNKKRYRIIGIDHLREQMRIELVCELMID